MNLVIATSLSSSRQPVIGLVVNPLKPYKIRVANLTGNYAISKHQVDFIQAGGSKTVPIAQDIEKSELLEILDQVNGIFL